jgi:hypothetical protein
MLQLVSPIVSISLVVRVLTSGPMIDIDDLWGALVIFIEGDITQEVRFAKNLASSVAPL